jgi:deazaflavin-dependent oxidoreductase (nitroreductase family)
MNSRSNLGVSKIYVHLPPSRHLECLNWRSIRIWPGSPLKHFGNDGFESTRNSVNSASCGTSSRLKPNSHRLLNAAELSSARTIESSRRRRLSHGRQPLIFEAMNLPEGSIVSADLTTMGRKTGQPRTVELRFVYYKGSFYASSSKIAGKHWCQNMIKNPAVEITAHGERVACTARQVTDENLRRQILTLRDSPPLMDRIVFEITPKA